MKTKLIGLLVTGVLLTGCLPTVEADIPRPPTQMTYAWVMVHDWQRRGIQVGTKVDDAGTTIAEYWWEDCDGAYLNCRAWGFYRWTFKELGIDPDQPPHYSIRMVAPDVWQLRVNGVILVDVPMHIATLHTEVNYGERTKQ